MAFFYNIKRALGFGSSDDYEDDVEGIDATVHPLSQYRDSADSNGEAARVSALGASDNTPDDASDTDNAQMDTSLLRQRIFESVVKIFNESMPEFIRESLDTESQQKYLYNALDSSVKEYFARVDEEARRRNRSSWEKERQRLDSENRSYSEKIKALEDRNEEGRKQQLSAERQKRALAERVHDLESRIATLEADKEQYELENKSLLNKLRLTSLQSDGTQEPMMQSGPDNAAIQQELDELKEKYSSAVAELAQMQAKADVADVMINDLNAKASDALQRQSTAESTLKAIMEERDTATTQAAQLQERLALANKDLAEARAEVSDAREAIKAIDEIQEQLSRFEEVKEAKEKRISELATENNRLMMIVQSLKDEASSLKKTIEANLYSQAENESRLRKEIDDLKNAASLPALPALEELPPEPVKPVKRKRKPKISAIDESIDDTDWLVAAPPKDSKSVVAESEVPFGYQPPLKKHHPENDAQMSLW